MSADRTHDLVLIGATGFTGGLTAEYLARNAPAGLRWAIAGRTAAKLERVRDRLATIDPRLSDLPLVLVDAADPASVRDLAEQTRAVITTVGPYALHGEPLVAACAAAGTDYADLTGEPEFVDRVWNHHHATAERTGARLVHCAGFDSIPHDIGAYFTVLQLPEGAPLTVSGHVRVGAEFSGGTYHSAVNGFARARQTLAEARERRAAEDRPTDRRVGRLPRRIRRDRDVGGWTVPLPTVDEQIVRRSARALPRYGPDFRYGHHMVARRITTVAALAAGVPLVVALAQLPPTRALLLRLKSAGDGPSEERRARSWFTVTFVGEGGGKRVVTRVSGGDPGYTETAKMLGETGLALALDDDAPKVAGQVTTAQALGDQLLRRLQRAGMSFEVVEAS
ncbi:MAG: saccharopine dehydrogenase NADP-binding domain-containing protein [Solirubrobacteraceae bacterium]|nr:saccharopine dehydrogenase NADP-binding domain-containing protein [Solirubrobacteraceae bacterium]